MDEHEAEVRERRRMVIRQLRAEVAPGELTLAALVGLTRDVVEEAALFDALARAGGDREAAARELDVDADEFAGFLARYPWLAR